MEGKSETCGKLKLNCLPIRSDSMNLLEYQMMTGICQSRLSNIFPPSFPSEYATLSILITDGPSLKGTLILEGPFARSEVENTKELTEQEHEFAVNSNRWTKHTMYKEKIDFETVKEPSLQALQEEVEAIEDDDGIPDDLPKEEMKKLIEQRRRKRVEARRIARRARETKERDLARLQEEKQGVPYQKTILANADGWYRGCIFASFNLVSEEIFVKYWLREMVLTPKLSCLS
jgi:hypothetical protein